MLDDAYIAPDADEETEASLSGRVRYFRKTAKAHRSVKASLKYLHKQDWADRLGEKEEIAEAEAITRRSVYRAVDDLDVTDAREAVDDGLMNEKELTQFIRIKREREAQIMRQARQGDDQQHSHRQR